MGQIGKVSKRKLGKIRCSLNIHQTVLRTEHVTDTEPIHLLAVRCKHLFWELNFEQCSTHQS